MLTGMRSTILRPLVRSAFKDQFGPATRTTKATTGSQCLICSFSRPSRVSHERRSYSSGQNRKYRKLNSTRNGVPIISRKFSTQLQHHEEAPVNAISSPIGNVGSYILEALESSSSKTSAKAQEDPNDLFVPPLHCPGCGAPSQTTEPGKSGYYSTKKKRREWLPRKVYRGIATQEGSIEGQAVHESEKIKPDFTPVVLPVLSEPTEDATHDVVPTLLLPSTIAEESTRLTTYEEEDDNILFRARITNGMEEFEMSTAQMESEIEGDEEEHESRDEDQGEEESYELEGSAKQEAKEDPIEVELRKNFFAEQEKLKPPLCGRCHSLLHHSKGSPLEPPTFAIVTKPITESQFDNIYIYHVVDAADFPLSVLPGLRRNILRHLPSSRSVRRNVSFSLIVTRADLLMPKESMVSSLMTYLRTVLKEALPEWMKTGEIRVVSAKNTWTTERVKKEIRGCRGSVFLIGRTNVGKSRLFESIYPRNNKTTKPGSSGWGKGDGVERGGFDYDALALQNATAGQAIQGSITRNGESLISSIGRSRGYQYVEMPTVNEMPGTTAGAIRVPFSNGKGELVDLPGLSRGGLLNYVRDECVKDTVMTSRITPEQCVLKPGQSLILGGLIRIAARTEKVTLIAYPFLTLPAHVTNHAKAQDLLDHPDPASLHKPLLWSKPFLGGVIQSAGTFALGWDVTQRRDPRLKHHTAAEMEEIPYKIYSTDLLVEGCGWVELVTSVIRWKDPPIIEVWSPLGKSIGSRPPMGAQALCEKKSKARPGSRPKRSMKGRAKEARRLAREAKIPEFWKRIGTMAREAREKKMAAEGQSS